MNSNKILILANDTTYTFNLRNEIIERLVEEGYEVVVVSKALLLQDELKSLGARLIDVDTNRHGKNPFSDLSLLMRYKKIFRIEKPSVVLTYNIKPNIYGGIACRCYRIPYIPNITGLGTAVEYPGIMQKLTTYLYKIGVSKANCIMFQNEENKQFFLEHSIISEKSRARLLPGSGVSLKIHKKLDYPQEVDKIHFLFIARVMAEKGIDLYLNAAKRIYMNHKNTMFHICGRCDDDKYIQLLEEAVKSGYISYHGEQKDMIPFFQLSHCVVHPSYYPEGMSNVLLEAAAHCRPIITTDRAGCRETVEDGVSGFLIPVKDEDALVNALEKFISLRWEEKKKMGLFGREKIEAEFNRQLVVYSYLDEIKTILSRYE